MLRRVLNYFGYDIEYIDERGCYSHRYNSADYMMCRQFHVGMSVAYPNARMQIFKRGSI